jgi:HEAT repeat protein
MDQHTVSEWAEALASGIEETQVRALRQMSSCESVTGVAPTVAMLSGSENDEVRMWAAEAMETAVQPAAADIKALIDLMAASPDGEVCYWSATMIGRLGVQGAETVEALERCLLNSNYLAAKERAVWALSQVGPDAVAALPALRTVIDEPDRHPRLTRMATEVIRRLTSRSIGEAAA